MEKELLQALAGVRSPGERCQFCNAPEDTPVGQSGLLWHDDTCPRRKAGLLLAQQGTPLKMWRVSYQTQRDTHINHTEQLVMRCNLSEQDALALVHRILYAQGKRQLVEGSLRIEELSIVPCE